MLKISNGKDNYECSICYLKVDEFWGEVLPDEFDEEEGCAGRLGSEFINLGEWNLRFI